MDNYLEINRSTWNAKVPVHLSSTFYNLEAFKKGKCSLNEIELSLLPNLNGKEILQLQCHFGQDSLSMSRLGAAVTGVDFSDKAIETARLLANELKLEATFIESDIYTLPEKLDKAFDIVFTSYGTIGWLPDLNRWAAVVSKFLKPDGLFIMADFHPVVWMYDDNFEETSYGYFNRAAFVETISGTYAERNSDIVNETVNWNHPVSDILNSLVNNGISIDQFNEFDYSPYNCFNHTIEIEAGKFQIKGKEGKIPMVYSILGKKN
jgi:2-polyprenyl-3-methyl-5-hydroxy-6-metoxy-1,4-benzoquinol methylase